MDGYAAVANNLCGQLALPIAKPDGAAKRQMLGCTVIETISIAAAAAAAAAAATHL